MLSEERKKATCHLNKVFGIILDSTKLGSPHQIDPDTPARFVSAYAEMLRGYNMDTMEIVKRVGVVGCPDQLIIVKNISFVSVCAHHLLPFYGSASVGYIPDADGAVCGLSKIPRLVEAVSCRLQLQEHITEQICLKLQHALNPRGVGVTVKAVHACMSCRGVRQSAETVTVLRTGLIQDEEAWFSEYSKQTGS